MDKSKARRATRLSCDKVIVRHWCCEAALEQSPILRFFDERATNGICVNGLEFRVNRLGKRMSRKQNEHR